MRKIIRTLVISGLIVVGSFGAVEAQQYQRYQPPGTYYDQPQQLYRPAPMPAPRSYAPPVYEGRNTATIYTPAPFFPGAAANSEAAIQWQQDATDQGGGY